MTGAVDRVGCVLEAIGYHRVVGWAVRTGTEELCAWLCLSSSLTCLAASSDDHSLLRTVVVSINEPR